MQKPAQVELIPFLRARIDEDAHVAHAAARWSYGAAQWAAEGEPDWIHIARHDPARVLREIDSKRALIEFAETATCLDMQVDSEFGVGPRTEPYIGHEILRTMAAAYSDHPDFQQEWQPTPSASSNGGRSEG
ncbi:hypothetical protein GS462_11155 [Rhodococcus hoagii]|nr:hypothetical protein [Prescottella equi]MBM4650970.1 hypothetical protein [Prescottella equi]MBM4686683.1 hypothetical protein [Prescottella equi]